MGESVIQIYLIIGLVVAALLGGGGLWIRALKAENAQMTQAYTIAAQVAIDNKAALEAQLGETKRVNTILLTRDQQRRTAEKRNEVLNGLLDNLKRSDPGVQAWSDAVIPDSVRSLLNAEGAGENGRAETVPAADPHPADRPPGQ